ncbi:succinate-semialdehyde dehydrogenase [Flavobacterium akiainvivens]|uniref:Succinate-semialdehyde dehydrogenase n=1 Tax=Flavobacterium akiainvivens TaxID=1202724 RepID=A0A0M9VHV6_9FLAO|nr:NAD-dependent succinate-semialdehyde dehydrogenase [Flavobacterium akiainvivens]KOS05962.1 succinate-semialdehyde dehydrogenase [Flavobacterium akiainvivens]SFQ53677.1 succinate-semialdehyde dehydrogenase / glutarate-semialdehyde dehydrogenase [Flavobacterium akiainvivens]
MFSLINPANQSFLSEHQYITDETTQNKISISGKAYVNWRPETIYKRLNFIKSLIFELTKNQHLLAKSCTQEMGKPIKQSLSEIDKCKLLCEYYLQNAEKFLQSNKISTNGSESFVVYEPLGVILGVMPWNFPYWQVFRFAIPAIIAGNTVVVKHASNVAGCAQLIEKLFIDAGFPEGVYQNLLIAGKQVKAVIDNPLIKGVSVTGSEKAGTEVASAAAAQVKKAVLELGGSNALIVLSDANLDEAMPAIINARFQNTGQSCIAAKRYLVHKDIYDNFLERFTKGISALKMGDPMDEQTTLGPLARTDLAQEVQKQVDDSVAMGAKIVLGGKRNDAFYDATVLTNVTPDMPIFKEEVFGPAVPVVPFDTFEEAVKLSNSTDFGLGVSIFTADVAFIKSKIHLFEEGAVFINDLVKSDPALPFGGVKRSGFGRELAENGLKEFVNVKTVFIK